MDGYFEKGDEGKADLLSAYKMFGASETINYGDFMFFLSDLPAL